MSILLLMLCSGSFGALIALLVVSRRIAILQRTIRRLSLMLSKALEERGGEETIGSDWRLTAPAKRKEEKNEP